MPPTVRRLSRLASRWLVAAFACAWIVGAEPLEAQAVTVDELVALAEAGASSEALLGALEELAPSQIPLPDAADVLRLLDAGVSRDVVAFLVDRGRAPHPLVRTPDYDPQLTPRRLMALETLLRDRLISTELRPVTSREITGYVFVGGSAPFWIGAGAFTFEEAGEAFAPTMQAFGLAFLTVGGAVAASGAMMVRRKAETFGVDAGGLELHIAGWSAWLAGLLGGAVATAATFANQDCDFGERCDEWHASSLSALVMHGVAAVGAVMLAVDASLVRQKVAAHFQSAFMSDDAHGLPPEDDAVLFAPTLAPTRGGAQLGLALVW